MDKVQERLNAEESQARREGTARSASKSGSRCRNARGERLANEAGMAFSKDADDETVKSDFPLFNRPDAGLHPFC